MNVFSWIFFGLLVGIVANLIDPHPNSGGLISAVILGILGALVGGFLANIVLGIGVTGFNMSSFVVAMLGSLAILVIERAIRKA